MAGILLTASVAWMAVVQLQSFPIQMTNPNEPTKHKLDADRWKNAMVKLDGLGYWV